MMTHEPMRFTESRHVSIVSVMANLPQQSGSNQAFLNSFRLLVLRLYGLVNDINIPLSEVGHNG